MLYVNPLDSTTSVHSMDAESLKNQRKKQAPEELERLFIFSLIKEIRKTADITQSESQNKEKALFEEMLDDTFAGNMAKSGQLGIAKQITAQLRLEEMQPQIRGKLQEITLSKGNGQGTAQASSTLAFARSLAAPEYMTSSARVAAR